jgi:phosphoglycolate phosphatase
MASCERVATMRSVALFDLDGTLTDPGVGIGAAAALALAGLGLEPLSPDQLRAFVGPPLQDSFAALGLTPPQIEAAIASYRGYYGERGLFENEVYPGVPEMLEQLRSEGYVLGVATSKPGPFAERIVEHFGLAGYFATVVGSGLDGSLRDKRDVIEVCLETLGPAPAVMVGDRHHDVIGATHHDLPCIGVTWGYGTTTELTEAGAAVIVDQPGDLPPAVSRFLTSEP